MENKEILKELTQKNTVFLVSRGNTALKQVINLFKDKVLLIQDQGGWFTYKQYSKKFKELKTDSGIIMLEELKKHAEPESVLLVNSVAAYAYEQPMQEIMQICKEKQCLVVNDASGSLGTEIGTIGDIILASFGMGKVLDLGYGGFIATNLNLKIQEDFDRKHEKDLNQKLQELPERIKYLHELQKKVKQELKNKAIIHREKQGINVIVKFYNESEKKSTIRYCEKNNYTYTLCPRDIRVKQQAVSIELKRK